jgi:hypothetical protein
MRGRRKRRKQEALRRGELREQAREIAGQSGEAFKAFAGLTGSAAKDFGGRTKEAAKEFVEAIEKAAKDAQAPQEPPRRSRRLLKFGLVLGVGIALLANERVRKVIASATGGGDKGPDYPEVWTPEEASTAGNGEAQASTVGEQSSQG